MMPAVLLFAMSNAAETTIVNLFIWGVLFPGLVTGLIALAVIKSMGERSDNQERKHRKRRAP
jgi:hypothetical protein